MWNVDMKKGFSLIEIMFVVFIVSVGFIAVASLTTKTIAVAQTNKNSLIANTLAQEGIELTRYLRDQNWLYVNGAPFRYSYQISQQSSGQGNNLPLGNTKQIFLIDSNEVRGNSGDTRRGSNSDYFKIIYSNDPGSGIATSECNDDVGCYLTKNPTLLYLFTDANFGYYGYDWGRGLPAGEATIFHRVIETVYHHASDAVANVSRGDYITATSFVYWHDTSGDHTLSLPAVLTDYSTLSQ